MNRILFALASATLLSVACGGSSHDSQPDARGTDDMATDDAAIQSGVLCQGVAGQCAAVATSIFNADFTGMGTLDTVNLDTKSPKLNIDATLDPDTTLKLHGGDLYVLQRDSGAVRIYDPATFAVKSELPTGDTAHPAGSGLPQDLYVADDGKIWVTLSGNMADSALAIVDPTTPGTLTYVALPQDSGDTDGKPEPSQLYACNGKLYVTMQSYTYDAMAGTVTYVHGRIVTVDLATRAVGKVITMTGKNPWAITQVGTDCSDVAVSNASGLTTSPDGTGDIERLNLTNGTVTGVLATDTMLAGRPTYLAKGTGNVLFVAQYFDPQPNGMGQDYLSSVKVVAFDISTKTVTGDITGKFGNVNFLEVQNGNLFLGAGIYANMELAGKLPRGLYITPADGTMLTSSPIDLMLTPSAIALP